MFNVCFQFLFSKRISVSFRVEIYLLSFFKVWASQLIFDLELSSDPIWYVSTLWGFPRSELTEFCSFFWYSQNKTLSLLSGTSSVCLHRSTLAILGRWEQTAQDRNGARQSLTSKMSQDGPSILELPTVQRKTMIARGVCSRKSRIIVDKCSLV